MKVLPILLLAGASLAACRGGPVPNVSSFEECVNAGFPIMESYPRRCSVPAGPTFVEELPPAASADDIGHFEGVFTDLEPVADDGSLYFAFYTDDGPEFAVLEPDAQVLAASDGALADARSIEPGTRISVRGWRDHDGLVHAVEVRLRD